MKLFTVKIVSTTYNLQSFAQLLANDEDQAKKMAADKFHESVTAFLAPRKGLDRSEGPTIPKEDLLRTAKYTVTCTDTPIIINSEWDKTK